MLIHYNNLLLFLYKHFYILIMNTYRELIYMVMDELKLNSDDSFITEDHVLYLLNKYRIFLLQSQYSKKNEDLNDSNYQTIKVILDKVKFFNESCYHDYYLRSTTVIPSLSSIGAIKVYPKDYFVSANFTFISKERFKFIGHNKYLKDIIYTTVGVDDYLYIKSVNPQFLYLKEVYITGIFENAEQVSKLEYGTDDILNTRFPLEENLIPMLINYCVKDLLGMTYRPEDSQNNAKDDLSNIESFIRNNVKSNLQKQIEGE